MIDIGTGQVAWARLGPRRFSGQPVPVPTTGGHVWLASLVLDTERRRSELWWFDSEDVAAPPVATVPLPHVVPFGARGCWVDEPNETEEMWS